MKTLFSIFFLCPVLGFGVIWTGPNSGSGGGLSSNQVYEIIASNLTSGSGGVVTQAINVTFPVNVYVTNNAIYPAYFSQSILLTNNQNAAIARCFLYQSTNTDMVWESTEANVFSFNQVNTANSETKELGAWVFPGGVICYTNRSIVGGGGSAEANVFAYTNSGSITYFSSNSIGSFNGNITGSAATATTATNAANAKFADYAGSLSSGSYLNWGTPNRIALFGVDAWPFSSIQCPSATRLNGKVFLYLCAADTNDYARGNIFGASGYDFSDLTMIGCVLTNSGGSAWDSGNVFNPRIFQYQRTNWMVYVGGQSDSFAPSSDWQLGLAYSHTGTNFTKYSGNPILTKGSSGQWDDTRITSACIVQDNYGKFFLFYAGYSDGTHSEIGFATADSIVGPYTKYSGNPVVSYNIASGSSDTEFPSILQDRYGWTMFFQHFDLEAGPRYNQETLTIATSANLTNWTVNPVQPNVRHWGSPGSDTGQPGGLIFNPFVFDDGGPKLLWENYSELFLSNPYTYNFNLHVRTNFIGGMFYTNFSGQDMTVQSDVWMTPAAAAGKVGVDIRLGNGATMRRATGVSFQTLTEVMAKTNTISTVVTNGEVYCFTNISSGAGNAAGLVAESSFIKYEK
jgi:hypothetical protein